MPQTRDHLRSAIAAIGALVAALCAPAHAGGGAHIVDDDAVLDPGVCHSENWITRSGARSGLLTVAPACTFAVLPKVELAAAFQHAWNDGTATSVAPGFKVNLQSADKARIGVALSATAVWNINDGRIDEIQFNLPMTIKPADGLALHANAGWFIAPGSADRHSLFWGAQAEYAVTRNLVIMGEVFGRDRGRPGAQAGLRWVTDKDRIDVDLLAGHRIDGTAGTSLTFGVTIRR